jgi:hypothetical protein
MGGDDIVSAIQHLKMAKDHLESFSRDYPDSIGGKMFSGFCNKIQWMFDKTSGFPFFSKKVQMSIREEINSDSFATPAIYEKLLNLTPSQRDLIEEAIDAMIMGIDVTIIDTK